MASKIKERIIENAVSCFASRGYSGCSTKELAKRADVTEGSLYRLFGSKQVIFHTALLRVASTAVPSRKVADLLDSPYLEEGITRALTALYKSFSAECVRLTRFALLEQPATALKLAGPVIDGHTKAIAKRIRAAISEGQAKKDLDATVAATLIYLAMRNLRFDSLFSGKTQRAQLALFEKMIQVWLAGVRN